MKKIGVTITLPLYVPDTSYEAPGTLNILAGHIRDKIDEALNQWASQPEVAKGVTLVSVEVQE